MVISVLDVYGSDNSAQSVSFTRENELFSFLLAAVDANYSGKCVVLRHRTEFSRLHCLSCTADLER